MPKKMFSRASGSHAGAANTPLFTTLPIEVLHLITSHLDITSAIHHSRTARPFLTTSDDVIWRHLGLALPEHFGKLPLIQPYPKPHTMHPDGIEDGAAEGGMDGMEGAGEAEDTGAAEESGEGEDSGNEGRNGEEHDGEADIADSSQPKASSAQPSEPDATDARDPYDIWALAEAHRAEQRHQVALHEKVQSVLYQANEARWASVRSLHLNPRPGSVHSMLQILDRVSADLEILQIEGQAAYTPDYEFLPDKLETLEVGLMDTHITLPSLQHLRVGSGAVWQSELVLQLVKLAPKLTSLDVELHPYNISDWCAYPDRVYRGEIYGELRTTKLRAIRYELGACFDDDLCNEELNASLTMHELLRASPLLEQFIFLWTDNIDDEEIKSIIAKLGKFQHLRDVYLELAAGEIAPFLQAKIGAYSSLRRLILFNNSFVDIFTHLPELPNLESLYLGPPRTIPAYPSIPLHPLPVHRMLHGFASALRNCPNLSIIHPAHLPSPTSSLDLFSRLDELAQAGGLGHVRSLVYDDEELLLARLLVDAVETADYDGSDPRGAIPNDISGTQAVRYIGQYGERRARLFEKCQPTWQDLSDYDGVAVPYEVIKGMLEVEGIAEAEWTGRGMLVGEAAWDVLTQWRESSGL